MSQGQNWYDILSKAAERCNLDLPWAEIDAQRYKNESDIASWVDHNLRKRETLSSEEFKIWQYLENKGSQQYLINDDRNPPSTPLDENDLEQAAIVLENQTCSYHAKSRTLKLQTNHSTASRNYLNKSGQVDLSFETGLERRKGQEKQRILFNKRELETELQQRIRANHEQLEKHMRPVDSVLKEKLRADARLLNALENSTSTTTSPSLQQYATSQDRLVLLEQVSILLLKARLDRIYLTQLATYKENNENEIDINDLEQVQDNLQSLYREIEDVASMTVDNEYGKTLRALEEERLSLANKVATQNCLEVTSKLAILTDSTVRLAARYRDMQAYQMLLHNINELYLQTQSHIDASKLSSHSQDLHATCHVPAALSRHLNMDRFETVADADIVQQAKRLSDNARSQAEHTSRHIEREAKSLVGRNSWYLQTLSSHSDDHTSDVKAQSQELDQKIASAKVRLENIPADRETNGAAHVANISTRV